MTAGSRVEGGADSGILASRRVQFFWLPLAHVVREVIGAAQLAIGFPTAIDGRVDRSSRTSASSSPTFVCAVPRIFEKVYTRSRSRRARGRRA